MTHGGDGDGDAGGGGDGHGHGDNDDVLHRGAQNFGGHGQDASGMRAASRKRRTSGCSVTRKRARGSSQTIVPSSTSTMRSPTRSASARSCVTKTMVTSPRSRRRMNDSCSSRRTSGSTALKGSSQEQRRRGDHGPGDADALLLAAGERSREARGEAIERQLELFEELARGGADARFVPSEETRDRGHVVVDRAVRKERGRLQHRADASAPDRKVAGEGNPVDGDGAGRRRGQSVEETQERGLPAPLRPIKATDSRGAM